MCPSIGVVDWKILQFGVIPVHFEAALPNSQSTAPPGGLISQRRSQVAATLAPDMSPQLGIIWLAFGDEHMRRGYLFDTEALS